MNVPDLMKLWLASLLLGLNLSVSVAAEESAILLVYQDTEGEGEPYQSRFIITESFMRLDYGRDGDDFILVDRKADSLVNVTHDARRVMELSTRKVAIDPPFALSLTVDQRDVADMPSIGGVKPVHHAIRVNNSPCEDVISAQGLFEDAVVAMRQFKRILAGQQAETLGATPADMINACEIALHVFHPEQSLAYGLPIRSWDSSGRKRELIDLRDDFKVSPELFTVPEGYSSYRLSVSGQ